MVDSQILGCYFESGLKLKVSLVAKIMKFFRAFNYTLCLKKVSPIFSTVTLKPIIIFK